jgi:hypothetical protein
MLKLRPEWIGARQKEEAGGQLLALSLCQLSLSGHPENESFFKSFVKRLI